MEVVVRYVCELPAEDASVVPTGRVYYLQNSRASVPPPSGTGGGGPLRRVEIDGKATQQQQQ